MTYNRNLGYVLSLVTLASLHLCAENHVIIFWLVPNNAGEGCCMLQGLMSLEKVDFLPARLPRDGQDKS